MSAIQLAESDIGSIENVTIQGNIYSRVKINPKYIDYAEQELKILLKLKKAPLVPTVFAHIKKNDHLWILFERLSLKSERALAIPDIIAMIQDTAVTLETLKRKAVDLHPVSPQTTLFNQSGALKFLDFGQREQGSILSCLFLSRNELSNEV